LWGGLHFLYPKQFTSKWNWAKNWLQLETGYYGTDIGSIQKGKEDEFYASLAPYAIRRLRSEVLPQLPKAQWIDVWCEMTSKQAKQYKEMQQAAEIRIEEKELKALGILAEYTRLKQFADAYAGDILDQTVNCPVCKGEGEIVHEQSDGYKFNHAIKCTNCEGLGKVTKQKVVPSTESGKIPYLIERLEENGISKEDSEGTSVAVVASQFREVVDMLHRYLNDNGIKAVKITGETKDEERTANQMLFRTDGDRVQGDARVICMTTTAGGVAITLDLADNVHIFDETWVPDDQEQLADRVFNASRMKQVGVYVYRSKNTVEEYIQKVTDEKGRVNVQVLDSQRQAFLEGVLARAK
jgi:SNF2 family DNA or RNA helicase